MDLGSALVVVLMVVFLKPAVMILGLRLIVRLGRALRGVAGAAYTVPRDEVDDLRLFWWSLAVFFVSECMRGVEVYVIVGSSPVFSALHASVSALGMGLCGLGLARLFDRKVLRFAEPGCAAARLCHGCTLKAPAGCKLRGVVELFAGLAALAALAPFFASAKSMAADTSRWQLPFPALNAWYDARVVPRLMATIPGYQPHGVGFEMQGTELLIEYRLVPGAALVLCVAALVLARARREALAVRLLSFGLGLLVYALLELVLYDVTGDVLLGSLGHELTELWFVVFSGALLARTYGVEPGVERERVALRTVAA